MSTYRNSTKNPSKNDDTIFDWSMNLVDDGRLRRRTLDAQWFEDIATYSGDFWADYDPILNQLISSRKPNHRVRLPVNLAQPAVRTEYAKLLKNRPMVDCLARSNTREDLNAAEVGDSVLNHYVEFDLHMPKVRRRMLQWLVICGFAGIFVEHDNMAMGETEVLVDSSGNPIFDMRMIKAVQQYYRDKKKAPKTMRIPQGQLRNRAFSPFQLIWDFSQLDLEDAWWAVYSEVMDVDDVFRRWEVEVDGDAGSKPGVLARRDIEKWDITTKPVIEWSRGETQKLVEVHRMFVRPGHRYFPEGIEVVFTDNELIGHWNFPFSHGLLPIAVCGHIPQPWTQHACSILPTLKPLVLELSKTESQMLENRNMMGNPPWIEFRQNRVKGEIVNKPGARVTIDWMPNVPEPHPIEMPDMAGFIKDLIPILKEHIQEAAGQSEVSQGKVPQGARAGVTIAYLQEEDDTKIGPTVLEYEECIERTAWLQLSTIGEFYDIPRTVRLYKKHGEPEVFDFVGKMLDGVAGVRCQAGSALPRSKAAKQQFILDLWDRGLEQDPRKVRDMLELSEGEPDAWEKDIDQAARENDRMKMGQVVIVKEWQNHPAHHYEHRDFMKSPEYDQMQPEQQQIFEDHDKQHSQEEQAQQVQMAVAQAMGGQGGPPQAGGPQPGSNGATATPSPQMSPTDVPGPGANGAPPLGGSTPVMQDRQPQ